MAGMAPMLATPGTAPSGPDWSWEAKWDGQRGIARIADCEVVVLSRNHSSITSTYPEIVAALRTAAGGRDVVVDGEIVALDAAGRPSFARLQRRMHTPRPRRPLLAEVPASFYLFDLLEVDGHDTASLPYLERRQLTRTTRRHAGRQSPSSPCHRSCWTSLPVELALRLPRFCGGVWRVSAVPSDHRPIRGHPPERDPRLLPIMRSGTCISARSYSLLGFPSFWFGHNNLRQSGEPPGEAQLGEDGPVSSGRSAARCWSRAAWRCCSARSRSCWRNCRSASGSAGM